jgi:hypothetical protein
VYIVIQYIFSTVFWDNQMSDKRIWLSRQSGMGNFAGGARSSLEVRSVGWVYHPAEGGMKDTRLVFL